MNTAKSIVELEKEVEFWKSQFHEELKAAQELRELMVKYQQEVQAVVNRGYFEKEAYHDMTDTMGERIKDLEEETKTLREEKKRLQTAYNQLSETAANYEDVMKTIKQGINKVMQ